MSENRFISEYQLEAWITRLGSIPAKLLGEHSYSIDYGMCEAHLFQLENGQYALVTEHGCSCYSATDADIDLYPTLVVAEEKFNEWVKSNKREEY